MRFKSQMKEKNQIQDYELDERENQVQDQELYEREEPGSGLRVRREIRTRFRIRSQLKEKNQVQDQELEEREEPGSGLGVR